MSGQVEVKRVICKGCHGQCRLAVYVRNNRLEKVEEDKDYPLEMFRIASRPCLRRMAAAEIVYHPDRVNYPLKRAGERGEGKWQQISWEQALDEIAAKLKEIKASYGAEAVATAGGTWRTATEYRLRFFNLFGSPNHWTQGHVCFGPRLTVSAAMLGTPNYFPGPNAGCTLWVGVNLEEGAAQFLWLLALEAKRRGAKWIVIDPRKTGRR